MRAPPAWRSKSSKGRVPQCDVGQAVKLQGVASHRGRAWLCRPGFDATRLALTGEREPGVRGRGGTRLAWRHP